MWWLKWTPTWYFSFSDRFTPDFSSSRVIRELKLVSCGGSEFVFVLNASLPYHMLAACAESLPRPNWEIELYIVVSFIMRYCAAGSITMGGFFVNTKRESHRIYNSVSSVLCFCWWLPRPIWRPTAYGSLSRDVCQWNQTPLWKLGGLLISGKLYKYTAIQSKYSWRNGFYTMHTNVVMSLYHWTEKNGWNSKHSPGHFDFINCISLLM